MGLNLYMSGIAFIGSFFHYVQAYKIFRTRSAEDLSILAFSISLCTSINWLIYGVMIKSVPLICCGGAGALGATLVLIGILTFRN